MAFLTIITRHLPARAALLERNRASLRAQSNPDYEQLVITDRARRGFAYARQMLSMAAPAIIGQYVLVLDDDDYMADSGGIAKLKQATAPADNPPVVIFRGQHADMGVLPQRAWGNRPERGDIGVFDFILRADVYRECVSAQSDSDYAYDHTLITAAYDQHAASVVWLDAVICAADQRRIGKD